MQELIEASETFNSYDLLKWVAKNKTNLLEKEKQQIIDAYCNAEDKFEFFEYEHRYGRQYLTSEDYYNQTYENNL